MFASTLTRIDNRWLLRHPPEESGAAGSPQAPSNPCHAVSRPIIPEIRGRRVAEIVSAPLGKHRSQQDGVKFCHSCVGRHNPRTRHNPILQDRARPTAWYDTIEQRQNRNGPSKDCSFEGPFQYTQSDRMLVDPVIRLRQRSLAARVWLSASVAGQHGTFVAGRV